MTETSRHDAWQIGASYDAYMGRWSRRIARHFLDKLNTSGGLDWFEVGCGTGALSAEILARSAPKSLVSIDSSEAFVATTRANVADVRGEFRVGDAQALDAETNSRDVVVSALVLNFVPDRTKALSEMARVARTGGIVAFYVWDYPGGGVQFMQAFWDAATSLDPGARDLAEDRRFPFCTPQGLTELAAAAGLSAVTCEAIEVPTVFRDFDDYWQPFTLGAGPAPGYCMSLDTAGRERLRGTLEANLPRRADGAVPLKARAWAIRSVAA